MGNDTDRQKRECAGQKNPGRGIMLISTGRRQRVIVGSLQRVL